MAAEQNADSILRCRGEHAHEWGRLVFVAGIGIRRCEKDCPATLAQGHDGSWERVDVDQNDGSVAGNHQ